MARPEIIEKLNTLLAEHNPLTEECQIVYLMVQFRKLLDYRGRSSSSRLRFYCDWTVHTDKTQNLRHISPIMEDVYRGVRHTLDTYPLVRGHEPVIDFLYLRDLQKEIKKLSQEEGIALPLDDEENWWVEFVRLMVNVLSNQPIERPIVGVLRFMFTQATSRSVFMRMDFTVPIIDHRGIERIYFEAGNAF